MTTSATTAVCAVLLLALGACGSEGPVVSGQAPVADQATDLTTSSPSTSTSTPSPVTLGDGPVESLTGEQVCAALDAAAATAAIGSEVFQVEPSSSQTPQCSYTYGGDSATLSTFTVAAQRPEDVGDRGLQDAFDHVLEVNRGLAEGDDLEEVDVDAGDRAARLSGSTLTLTVVAATGHLLTIVTTPDLDTTAVEALAVAAADAVGG